MRNLPRHERARPKPLYQVAFISRREDHSMAPRDPVFIIGGARSGTTILAKLLDSHPDVLYRHEPDSILVNTEIPFLPRREELETYLAPARHYLDALRHVRATKVSGQRPVFDKTYRSSLQKNASWQASIWPRPPRRPAGRSSGNPWSSPTVLIGASVSASCI